MTGAAPQARTQAGGYRLRPARPADYDPIAAVADKWWGRPVLTHLPRLFLDHFHATSLIAEGPDDRLVGFVVGLLSPSQPDKAYIQFVAVVPHARRTGLARALYEGFFRIARHGQRHVVNAVTAPTNTNSIAFHHRMGFTAHGPVPDYDGPGNDLIVFTRAI
jgi:ribosomal protein S18 acetylase RimI-like enzyme